MRPRIRRLAEAFVDLSLAQVGLGEKREVQRWLAAEPRGYSFVARIVRDVIDRDMVLPGERARIRSGRLTAT